MAQTLALSRSRRDGNDLVHVLDRFSHLLVPLGMAMVLASVVLPWMNIFHGLQVLRGIDGDGAFLAGLGVGAALLWLLALANNRPSSLLQLGLASAAVLVAYTGYEIWRLGHYAAAPGPAGVLVTPSLGPGPFVMLMGAVLLLAGIGMTRRRAVAMQAPMWDALGLAAALFGAGWIHLALSNQHLAENSMLGLGFVSAGLAQVGLAIIVLRRPSTPVYLAVVMCSVGLMFLYAYAVFVGLPVGSPDHHDAGLRLGSGEPVTIPGAITQALQLTALAIAFARVGSAPTSARNEAAEGAL